MLYTVASLEIVRLLRCAFSCVFVCWRGDCSFGFTDGGGLNGWMNSERLVSGVHSVEVKY
jgi:hypothetical protein